MQVFAPAKINLSLKILGRRDDGFHEIETLIARISLCDEINIDKDHAKEGIEFRCDDPSVPQGDDNLAVRAAKTFLERAKLKSGVAIELKKKIPHGAGLGGGSSDAATTLLALNELFKTNLPREALAKMGETIGSDVPFFIFQSAAICRGRGELVTPIQLPESLSILLLKPAFVVLNGMGIFALAGFPRNSRYPLRSSTIRSSNFHKRSGASRFREVCFSSATEDVVAQTTGSGRGVDVRVRFHGLRGDASKRRCRSSRNAGEIRARCRIVDVRVQNDWVAHASRVLVSAPRRNNLFFDSGVSDD